MAVVATVLIGVGYGLGSKRIPTRAFAFVERQFWPRQKVTEPEDVSYRRFESILVPLEARGVAIPYDRYASGGAVTRHGDGVLVLTHEGKIFFATGTNDLMKLSISTPDNGYSDYVAAANSRKYSSYVHNFFFFRYIDVEDILVKGRRGIAISYIDFDPEEECYSTVVATLDLQSQPSSAAEYAAGAEAWRELYRTQPCLPLKQIGVALEGHMAGGRLAFDGTDTLYVTSGDYYWDGMYGPKALAQDMDADYGKVLAIDLATSRATKVAAGTRNAQGVTIDADGAVWIVEHGARGGDELNRVEPGANFGWPEAALGTDYTMLPLPFVKTYGRHDEFDGPVFAWLPSVAPSSLTLADGMHPSWDGDLLMGTLRDQSIHRLRIVDGRVQFDERIDFGRRIRDVAQLSAGRLAVYSDDHVLFFVTVAEAESAAALVLSRVEALSGDAARNERVRAAFLGCLQCHSVDPISQVSAPTLAALVDRPVAMTGFPSYSEALRTAGGVWSVERLRSFLENPQAVIPGTSMPNPGLDRDTAEGLIELLGAKSDD
jgi:cytochrome c2